MIEQPKPLVFIPLRTEYIPACGEIAAYAPDPWTAQNLQDVLTAPHHATLVALAGEEPAAFASFLLVEETADLQLIAVHPSLRRQGVGRQLLAHSLGVLQQKGARRCLLEVRAGNLPAIALYQSFGFKTLARRPGMYTNPKEDGLLMAAAMQGAT